MISVKKDKRNYGKIITTAVFASFILSFLYVLMVIILSPKYITADRTTSEYALMLLQCILGIFAMLLPGFLEHRIKLIIPSSMLIPYALFLYGSIYLGEVRDFYFIIPHWDTVLHTFSGCMLGALGFSFVSLLNDIDNGPLRLNEGFVAVFAFCFAVALGVVWEIYEYVSDGILGLNMQKFMLKSGELLVGRAALADTMKDLMVDCLGALAVSLAGYVSLKDKTGWLERYLVKKKDEN